MPVNRRARCRRRKTPLRTKIETPRSADRRWPEIAGRQRSRAEEDLPDRRHRREVENRCCEDGWKVWRGDRPVIRSTTDGHGEDATRAVWRPHLCADGKFATADGKGHFVPVDLPPLRLERASFLPAQGVANNSTPDLCRAGSDQRRGSRLGADEQADADELGLANGDRVQLKRPATLTGECSSHRLPPATCIHCRRAT